MPFFHFRGYKPVFLSEALPPRQFGHNYHSQHSQSNTPLDNNRLELLFYNILSFTSSTTFTPHCDSIFYPLHSRTIIFWSAGNNFRVWCAHIADRKRSRYGRRPMRSDCWIFVRKLRIYNPATRQPYTIQNPHHSPEHGNSCIGIVFQEGAAENPYSLVPLPAPPPCPANSVPRYG